MSGTGLTVQRQLAILVLVAGISACAIHGRGGPYHAPGYYYYDDPYLYEDYPGSWFYFRRSAHEHPGDSHPDRSTPSRGPARRDHHVSHPDADDRHDTAHQHERNDRHRTDETGHSAHHPGPRQTREPRTGDTDQSGGWRFWRRR